jgi:NitT/TauT family transport system substrate-binding protein
MRIEGDAMKPMVITMSVIVLALGFLQAAAQPVSKPIAVEWVTPVTDVPRPAKLNIGYITNIFITQFAGVREKGWYDELGVKHIEFLRFTSGSPMLQAIAAGEIDIAYIGSGPVVTAAHRGVPVKSVAATSKDPYAFIAIDTFADLYATNRTAAAFAAFTKQASRKLQIGTAPRFTTPDVLLHMWLVSLGASPEQDVNIVPMGTDQLVAAMLAGQIDGVVYGEPQITLLRQANPRFKAFYGKDFVPDSPGGVVMVQQRLIDQYPGIVEKLVEIHLRANKLFNADKDFFAKTVTGLLGEEFLPLAVAQAAVRSPAITMVTNPRTLADTLAAYDAFLVQQGVWPKPLRIEEVFDYRFYDAVVAKHPELAD